MKHCARVAWLLVFAAVGGANAQAPPPAATPIVETVGCLSQAGTDWVLENATDAAVSRTPFTTPEAVKAAAQKPLGPQRYRLLGAAAFGANRHKGHKMAVKGLLIKGSSDTRINVTSFQMLAETCAK